MAERINIDIDLIENGGHGLYAFEPDDGHGIYICEERQELGVHVHGDYLSYDTDDDNTVLTTVVDDNEQVKIIDAETREHHFDIHNSDITDNIISGDVLEQYELIMLELVN